MPQSASKGDLIALLKSCSANVQPGRAEGHGAMLVPVRE